MRSREGNRQSYSLSYSTWNEIVQTSMIGWKRITDVKTSPADDLTMFLPRNDCKLALLKS
jgi:hypothetical protein